MSVSESLRGGGAEEKRWRQIGGRVGAGFDCGALRNALVEIADAERIWCDLVLHSSLSIRFHA